MKKWRFFPKFAERIKIERLKIMDNETKLKIEEKIIDMLKTVYDPEIPVNVYDLGLIYKIDLQENGELTIDMTLTAPNCPAADLLWKMCVRSRIGGRSDCRYGQSGL